MSTLSELNETSEQLVLDIIPVAVIAVTSWMVYTAVK